MDAPPWQLLQLAPAEVTGEFTLAFCGAHL